MPQSKTTKSPSKDTSSMIRAKNGSSFVECPKCKKSVPAALKAMHQLECKAKQENSPVNEGKKEEAPKKRVAETQGNVTSDKDESADELIIKPAKKTKVEENSKKEEKPSIDKQEKKVVEPAPAKESKAEDVAPNANAWKAFNTQQTPKPVDTEKTIIRHMKDPNWRELLQLEFKKPYFIKLLELYEEEKKKNKVFPPEEEIFNAFNFTPFNNVKVVIIGQDPYHGNGQAHGLSFSVKKGVSVPPSLRNIYKELRDDLGDEFSVPEHGNLERWAKQGVMMLNATLTVRAHEANSHSKFGWQNFTDAVIKLLSDKKSGLVFILWGRFAQDKAKGKIDSKKHKILSANHPSPFSADKGFFGSKPFSKANEYLKEIGKVPIDWNVDGDLKDNVT